MKKQLFIGSDLYLEEGVMPLCNQISIALLKDEYGEIKDGMKIWLSAKTMYKGKIDPTIFPGIIRDIGKHDPENEEYEILVNESDMEYLSESKEFSGYSIEDVLNREKFQKKDSELYGKRIMKKVE